MSNGQSKLAIQKKFFLKENSILFGVVKKLGQFGIMIKMMYTPSFPNKKILRALTHF